MNQNDYRTTRKWRGRWIVISLADVKMPLGNGPEVMVMYASNGREIECIHPDGMEEGKEVYQRMLEKYPEDPGGVRRR